jgi:hypothetical protein
LQAATPDRPYSIQHRLELAKAYKRLGYPDLSASDAYKALLLIDEVVEEGEYHEEALEALRSDWISKRLAQVSIEGQSAGQSAHEEDAIRWVQAECSVTAYVSYHSIQCLPTVHY